MRFFSSSSTTPLNQKKDLFEVLLQKGYLDPAQVRNIFSDSQRIGRPKEEILEEKGWVSDDRLALVFSIVFDLPIVHLGESNIASEVLFLISKEQAEELKIIAFGQDKGQIKIGIVNPFTVLSSQSKLNTILEKNKIVPSFYIVSESDFVRALTQYEGGKLEPFKKKNFYSISLKGIDIPFDVINKIPEEVARKYKMIAFGAVPDKLLKVAVTNPKDAKLLEILDFIEKRTGLEIETYATTPGDLEEALKVYQSPPPAKVLEPKIPIEEKPSITIEKVAAPVSKESEKELSGIDIKDIGELEEIVKGGYVPKIVASLINFACKKQATDIHIQPYEKELLVRYRVDGLLRDIVRILKELHPAIISRIKILSSLKIDEQRIPQDGRFDVDFEGKGVDIRVSTLPTACGEKAVLRLLDKSFGVLSLEQIGVQGDAYKRLVKEIEKPYGIILATGPTGSGKTTTLYAILNRVKNPTVNIITLEDPVEYKIDGVNQSQVRPDIKYSFASGLRSILRQDPNIIMVGEIRDTETAFMVTQAALTGHLVLSTLHTNDASSAVPRMINMGVEPFLITSSINAVIAQRLVRKVCQKCQQKVVLSKVITSEIERELLGMPKNVLDDLKIKRPFTFRKGSGCEECDRGYKGRIGLFEILIMSEKIESLAIKRMPASLIEEQAKRDGMISMKQDGILKVLQGITTYEEILRMVNK